MCKKEIHVAHRTTGRVRLKVPHGKGDPEALEAVADAFRGIPGIEGVETNPVTGSVILNYDPDLHGELADAMENKAKFLAEHSAAARGFVEFGKRVDREIKVASGNNIDLKLVLAGGVVAATVLGVGATAATPVWITLLLFGTNHFVELHTQSAK